MTKYLRRRWHEKTQMIRECEHRSEKLALALVSALFSAAAIRGLAAIGVVLLPEDTFAAELAQQVMSMSGTHFFFAAMIAALGGAASMFHELRSDIAKFTFQNAVGHMVIAQFAGLLAYLVAVSYAQFVPVGLILCGGAGWGGGKAIAVVNDAVMRRLGLVENR